MPATKVGSRREIFQELEGTWAENETLEPLLLFDQHF